MTVFLLPAALGPQCQVSNVLSSNSRTAALKSKGVSLVPFLNSEFRGNFVVSTEIHQRHGGWGPVRSVCVRAGIEQTQVAPQGSSNAGPDLISLGTMELASNVDLPKLRSLMLQWANSLTANANIPLPAPIQVDAIDEGTRLSYIRLKDGFIETLVYIDVKVTAGEGDRPAMFTAMRGGTFNSQTPPGEPTIMSSMRGALIKALALSRTE
eukprot:TRINITY_DN23916_c0_g1_i1.p1 TRINITY_DN23916_c0_g1~~TRINITY_DN23916_c0_g1_i1.p1  ORF type:complete len:210 (-),score=12.09 TRINITY_DN23916_c0_g1_i1:216-845(-)